MTPAQKALGWLCANLPHGESWAAADWALTLHMLEHLAPRFFAEEQLEAELAAALETLCSVPRTFPLELEVHEAMARVDAVHFRKLRGLEVGALDGPQLAAWVERHATQAPLEAWFIAEAARELGIATAPVLASRHPFEKTAPAAHLYQLTHEVLLATGYFSRRAQGLEPVFDVLAAALPGCLADREWDLAAEMTFTLESDGRHHPAAQQQLALAQRPDGSMIDAGPPRERTHAVATALLAFASGRS